MMKCMKTQLMINTKKYTLHLTEMRDNITKEIQIMFKNLEI